MFPENAANPVQTGWIEVITGSMFSGKTEELLRRLRRAVIAKQKIGIFKPKIENRYSSWEVVSHDMNSYPSTTVDASANILLLTGGVDVVGIDEAQFFDHELTDVCTKLANQGVRVIVAGLDIDFKGVPFGPIPTLMAVAEYVTKVHAICARCGNLAHYSFRTSDSSKLLVLGSRDDYEPLCRKCYNKALNK
jgi:thymidine kinase